MDLMLIRLFGEKWNRKFESFILVFKDLWMLEYVIFILFIIVLVRVWISMEKMLSNLLLICIVFLNI